jgi:hypothetical protein
MVASLVVRYGGRMRRSVEKEASMKREFNGVMSSTDLPEWWFFDNRREL